MVTYSNQGKRARFGSMGIVIYQTYFQILQMETYILGRILGGGGSFFLISGNSGVTSIAFINFLGDLTST